MKRHVTMGSSPFPVHCTTVFPRSAPGPIRCRSGSASLLLALLIGLALLARNVRPAAAHAALETSDPAANAVLPTALARITLRFTEPLERSYSRAELFDQTGNAVPGATSRAGGDRFTMVVDLPPNLPNGTYSVLWRTLSEADGHTAQNYVAFTVGSQTDVRVVMPPAVTTTGTGPPDWLRALSRWLALLGLAAVVGVWPTWLLVLRPAISPAWRVGPVLARRVRRLATGAIGLAVVGSVFALLVQAAAIAGSDGLVAGLATTLGETRYGSLWLLRVGLFLLYAAALAGCTWWRPWRHTRTTATTLGLTALLPLPFSLNAHASAQSAGRATAVAFDVLHLLAASLWVGGLFVLLGALVPMLPQLTPAERRQVLARALPRFSLLALVAWAILGFTGLYSAWLQVGNLDALRDTAYGRSLALKVGLLVPLLVLGAFNLLVITRRVRRPDGARATNRWSRRFAGTVAAEVVLVVLVLLVVGRLIGQAPARDELAQAAGRLAIDLKAEGQQATLYLTPGATGPNHYRLELGSGHAAHTAGAAGTAGTEALLRLELPSRETGQKQIALTPVSGGAFEAHGSELSIAGDWTIQVIVRRPGTTDWTATVTQSIDTAPSAARLPGPAWRFGPSGIAGLLLLVAGVAGLGLAWQAGRAPLRKESAGLAAVAFALGVLLLLQARVGSSSASADAPAPAGAVDGAAVARGEALFAANCVACHGARGRGDGPAAAGLNPPPADLASYHARFHRDEDVAFWIANGIPGSSMPAFGDRLGEAEVRDLVAYLRALPDRAGAAQTAPGPDECRVAPRSPASLLALGGTPSADGSVAPSTAPRPTPTPLDPGAGEPADAETIAGVTATVRELVACTNARDTLRRLALYTDTHLRPTFVRTPPGFADRVATQPVPAQPAEWVAIVAIEDVRLLPDGRAVARVVAATAGGHTHGPAPTGGSPPAGVAAGSARTETNVFVLARAGDRWLVDEVRT